MTLDDEECFRTAHLGAAVAHFESRFSIDLAGRAAEAFGYLQLHGAAVEASSGTVLIVEGEGKGKTSLALALLALGAAPVTDDSILLVPARGASPGCRAFSGSRMKHSPPLPKSGNQRQIMSFTTIPKTRMLHIISSTLSQRKGSRPDFPPRSR